MNKRKKKKNRLSARQIHEKVTKIRKLIEKEFGCITWHDTNDAFGEILAMLIHKGLISHNKGKDSYHFGLTLA